MLFQTSSEFSSQLPPGVSGVSLNHADFTVRTSARNLDPRASDCQWQERRQPHRHLLRRGNQIRAAR